MEKNISERFASYAPVAYKSFAGALNAFLRLGHLSSTLK